MIKFITGLPGAGKSLRAVQLIAEAIAEGRNVYVFGLDGLDPELGPWERIDSPNDWQDLPDGSLVVIDEAQKVWPQRRAGDPAPFIRALSEHRHRGFDFLVVTQHPSMVDKYVRTLGGEHQHVIRQFGTQAAKLVTWSEVYDDPQSVATRARGTESLWRYPKHLFDKYKSATLHTVKSRIPLRLKLIPVLLVAVCVAVYFAFSSVTDLASVDPTASQGAVPASGSALPGGMRAPGTQAPKYATPADYAVAHLPRIQSQPWSAPEFDSRGVVSHPELYCASSETGRCVCHTEQGTRYAIEPLVCHEIVANGLYNPYRERRIEQVPVAQAAPSSQSSYQVLPGIVPREVSKYPVQSSPFSSSH